MRNTPQWPADDIETLISQYGDMLFRLCLIMLKNKSDAEDAVQETYIKYFQKSPSFESKEHRKAWLIRVATNQCRDMLRYRCFCGIRRKKTYSDAEFICGSRGFCGLYRGLRCYTDYEYFFRSLGIFIYNKKRFRIFCQIGRAHV